MRYHLMMRTPRPRRLLQVSAVLIAGLAAAVPTASAAVTFTPCADHADFECATVTVPLDRTGQVPGTVPLHVERQRGTGGRPTAWIGLAGGPGQSGADLAQNTWKRLGAPVAGTDQILTFDQRGTGQSGLIDCSPAFAKASSQAQATALCGAQVGSARPFYTTTDSVADLDAVREAAGAGKVVLVGVSYGTYVALRYARTHPDRVAALVLDSTVPLGGVSQWNAATYAAVPRILRTLCAGGACSFTKDPVADMKTVAARMRSGARGGVFVSASGRRSTQRLGGPSMLFSLLLDGDFSPQARAYVPSAMTSARAGDWAPLVRLIGLDFGVGADAVARATNPQSQESDGLFLATSCTDTSLPWLPSAPVAARIGALRGAADALVPAAFRPFDTTTALETSAGNRCASWPATAAAPFTDTGAPLNVPALLISGGADIRTPTEDAERTRALIPGAALVSVTGVGHYVLGNDPTGCAFTAYTRFLTAVAPGDPCTGKDGAATTQGVAPLRLADVPTLGRAGTAGRVARAAARTMADALASARIPNRTNNTVRIGGLRGGRITATFSSTAERVTLRGTEFVPGIRVSGTITSTRSSLRATMTVNGGPRSRRGTVRIVDNRLTATIGGRRITSVGGKRSASAASAAGPAWADTPLLRPGVDIG